MTIYSKQRTIGKPVSCSGVGVHSGQKVNLTLKPAPINHGIKFSRVDLPNKPIIPALFRMVVDTSLATVIGKDGFIVSTIEHLMSCFSGFSIDNILVEVDAYEVPIMDGSGALFSELIEKSGVVEQEGLKYFIAMTKPIEIEANEKFVGIYPYSTYKITCTIEYDHPLIKTQTYSIDMFDGSFEKEISKARTFGFFHEVEYLKKYGFAKGGSLDNVIVIGKDCVLNEKGLRYKDEFVRHKILDCIGDFSLLGMPLLGHVIAKKSGHAFNHKLIEEIFSKKDSWKTMSIEEYMKL
ncbi:MAG: UDP-3-O-acyl-N-acetylglucosamine deacetylase [Desulfobacterales bacterium]|nr:UDP-3-O-acyl-N-acetylglucosamine deacetylase [Desulfobacterales bacterium]